MCTLDSTFSGVHLDSTSLGVHLDSKAMQEQQQSTGHGSSKKKQLAGVLLVHTCKAVQGQQRSTGHGPPGKTANCGPLDGHEQGGTGTAGVDWAWEPPGKTAPPQLLSEARTRAAGGGEVKTGEEELLSMQEPR